MHFLLCMNRKFLFLSEAISENRKETKAQQRKKKKLLKASFVRRYELTADSHTQSASMFFLPC